MPSERKTVKCRIALAVDFEGKWAASGYAAGKEEHAFDFIIDDLASGEARYWVEVEVPVPVVAVVDGKAKEVTRGQ